MKIEQIIEIINSNYSPLTTECKTDLIKVAKILQLEKATNIVSEGQFADKAYFIARGATRAYYIKDDRDITDWFAFENHFICSINSFFLNIPSPHYIETIEPSILLEISRESITILSDKYKEFDRLNKIILTNTMLQLQQRIVSIQFETAQQKYDNLLNIREDITQRASLTNIASYLGITLETLSRIRNPKKKRI